MESLLFYIHVKNGTQITLIKQKNSGFNYMIEKYYLNQININGIKTNFKIHFIKNI